MFKEQEVAFLAGVAAALMSESETSWFRWWNGNSSYRTFRSRIRRRC